MEISNALNIPKETTRRKINELVEIATINKTGKKIILDKSLFPFVRPDKSIIRVSRFLIKSAHDVSIGGIITAVSKMCIKGNKGINLKKPKYLINEIEYFFAEDQGRYIIEVSKDSLKKVTDILNKNAVHYDELGMINEDQLFINDKTKVSIDELRTSNTSWLTNYMSK